MKRMSRLVAVLSVTAIVIGLVPVAAVASVRMGAQATQPSTASQQYFLSFGYVSGCTFVDSVWRPNAAPWYVCADTSSPAPQSGPCAPKISSVGPTGAAATRTLKIIGSCFGTGNTTSAADTAYFRISDLKKRRWNGCWTGDPDTDQVTCDISAWTNTTIIFNGFTGAFGRYGWVIGDGDHLEIQVWNPQSGKGPVTCEIVAGSNATTNC
jgi:hypothetical protein